VVKKIPVAILGAGLTGMSAALTLRNKGIPFRIFERHGHAGGHAITLKDQGFRFDRTGHLLHLRDAEMRDMVLGYLKQDWVEVKRNSVVWSNGVYTRYPFQANTFGLPPAVANECLMGFLKAHYTPASERKTPKNFEEFCLATFGEGISRHFMIPYNARLWGVHPSEITADWCQRFVPMPKLEDVVAGAVGLNDRELGYNTSFVYPRLGIGELSDAMGRDLPEIEFNKCPRSIDLERRQLVFDDETVEFETLISTAPLAALIQNLSSVPEPISAAARKLRCNALYYLDVATRVPSGTPHHWVYVPEAKYPFYRLGCYSHFSQSMAPEGKACFYVELADRTEPNLETLLPQVVRGMVEMGILKTPEDIEFARVRKIDFAYVVFDHEYFASTETVFAYLKEKRIVSTGRYGGWNYSSMEDALIFGRDSANRVLSLLGE
jgi:protoporphyrinogen oxidase